MLALTYGLYFGVLGRDVASITSELMATSVGVWLTPILKVNLNILLNKFVLTLVLDDVVLRSWQEI